MTQTMDQLPVIKDFLPIQQLMANQTLKQSIRLLCVFGSEAESRFEVIFATNDDEVYGFGLNFFGRLGVGVDTQHIREPMLNTVLTGKGLVNLWYGYGFCVGLTRDGQCYSWGDNKFGQLGIGTKKSHNSPQLIRELKNVVDVACGSDHTLALTSDGHVFSFGTNKSGQLGNRSYIKSLNPSRVPISDTITSVSCGKAHCVALSDSGRVWLWGMNEFGQLGRDPEVDNRGPKNRPFSNDPTLLTGGPVIAKALCGPNNTLLLSLDGHMYAFGENIYGQIGNGSRNPQYKPIRICNDMCFRDIYTHYDYRMAIAVSTDDTYYVWGHPISGKGFVCTPHPIPESVATHTAYDIYAKYSRLAITFKTIVFNNGNNSFDAKTLSIADNTIAVNGMALNPIDVNLIDFEEPIEDAFKIAMDLSTNVDVFDFNYLRSESIKSCSTDSNDSIGTIRDNTAENKPMNEFSKNLLKAFDNQYECDLVFRFNGKSIYCHKTVLKIRNQKFYQKCLEMLSENDTNDNEIHIKSYSYECFYAFLQFLYGMVPEINDNNRRDVLKLSTNFDEPLLQEMCGQGLDEEVVIDLSNICGLYERAVDENCVDLKESCVEFARNHWKDIIKSDAFQAMSAHMSHRLMQHILH